MAQAPMSQTAAAFVRSVTPFSVFDSTGREYGHPFLGGLNIPRPQLVDIDGDEDLDLFIQEYSNAIMLFERVGLEQHDRRRGYRRATWYSNVA